MSYGYRQLGSGRTTGQVSSYRSEVNGTATAYTYTYDSNGNITRITDQSGKVTRYTYDKLGQLTREDNPYLNKTYVYTYDNAGNRLSKKKYAYTTGTPGNETATESYNYTGDRLTQVGSIVYQYDAIGNPTTYNGYTLEWNGRKLMEMSMNGGQFLYTFAYNAEGIRTVKTNGSTIHHYTLNGSQIVTETWTTKSSSGAETPNHFLVYLYDENGAPIGLQYRNKSDAKNVFYTYYFEKNLQGDIVAIYTENGTKIGSYTYDAWGNCTVSTESGTTTIQKRIVRTLNPFRYRGYYYDTETGLYYLQSRYYNPQWGRFLNADGYVSTGTGLLGYNMYAYCDNNPVMSADYGGEKTTSFGLTLSFGFAGAGYTISIFLSADENDDLALQWSYSVPKDEDTRDTEIGVNVGIGVFFQGTDRDSVEDLNGAFKNIGIAAGAIGADIVTDENNKTLGSQIGISAGIAGSAHVNETYTRTIGSPFPALIKIIKRLFGREE